MLHITRVQGLLILATLFLASLIVPDVYAQNPFGDSSIVWIWNLLFSLVLLYCAYIVIVRMSRSLRRIEAKLGIPPDTESHTPKPPLPKSAMIAAIVSDTGNFWTHLRYFDS
jgi:hypothetical protein